MGRNSKYTAEIKRKILWALAETGENKSAIEACDISETTFYRWYEGKQDFRELIARGKEMFRDTLWQNDPDLYSKAVAGLRQHLDGAKETWKKVTVKEIPLKGGKKKEIKIRSTSEVVRPPAKWAIDRILGVSEDDNESKSLLESLHTQMQKNYEARHSHD